MEDKLIKAVKNHEILYTKSSIYYRNKNKRAAAWNAISKEVNLPEDFCQARWRYLRDKFVKKMSESHRASGSGAEVTEDQWQYQSQMEFLREHIKPRKRVTSLSEESLRTEMLEKNRSESVDSMPETSLSEIQLPDDPLSSSTSTSSHCETSSTSRKRSRREIGTAAFNEFLSKMTSIAEAKISRTKSDPHNGFFGMVREMFDKMDPEDVENAKISFLNYLHEQRIEK